MAEQKRRSIIAPAPGGNQWSKDADAQFGMDRFVHLCFRPNHPMEHRARQDGRIQDSVFLEINGSVIQTEGVMFTPDVSNKSRIAAVPIREAVAMIDFEVLYTRTDWNDPAVQIRLRTAEKCELLVPDHIPLSLIRNVP